MGQEWGQSGEWRYDQSLEWHLLQYLDHEGTQMVVRDLNRLYCAWPALAALDNDPGGFQWINCHDADNSIVSFLRYGPGGMPLFAVVCNFTPVTRHGYRIGLPKAGVWKEVLNTDADFYGGTGVGNLGAITAEGMPWDYREYSAPMESPGLSTVIFQWEGAMAAAPAVTPVVAEPAPTPTPAAVTPSASPAAVPEPVAEKKAEASRKKTSTPRKTTSAPRKKGAKGSGSAGA
jgi:hypothetical protein